MNPIDLSTVVVLNNNHGTEDNVCPTETGPEMSAEATNLENLMARVQLAGAKQHVDNVPVEKPLAAKPAKSRTRRGGTRRHRAKHENVPAPVVNPTPMRWERRSSMTSCSSMSTVEEPPRKIIRLRPHRSQDLYEAQRKDSELRTLMKEGTKGLTVRNVHGKSLVFFDSMRVYIPETLRHETLAYYRKNYKYSHKQRLEESCYWPRMDRDYCREYQWKIKITHPYTKESTLVYDSDDFEFPSR